MDYDQTLEYLYDSLPMFSKTGASAYKKDITNTALLCNFLGNPQQLLKCIHVAGTNGKGSTSHMLAAVFQEAGYKTGLYTSPHLHDFRERIKINGKMISRDFVVEFVRRIRDYAEEIKPSFFELTVAMMLQYFKEKRVDIAIVETGLGGRLDSTNIIDPELSIITNISFDHTNILGNTLQEIAFEKAGIIKKNKPVVIGEASQELTALFKGVATGNNSPIFFAEEKYEILNSKPDINSLSVTLTHRASNLGKTYTTDLGGNYQLKNLRTVVLALDVLRQHFTITTEAINKGLSNVKDLTGLHGRWEKIADDPITILDVGHNEAGIKAILQQIQMLSFSTLHIVIGVVRDKDVTTILSLLPVEAVYYFTSAHIPRALPAEDLQSHAAVFSLKGDAYNSVNDALSKARSVSKKTDLIVVCGSVYLIGEVQRGT